MTATHHLRHAARSLARAPGYSAAFILTLGLAIGVNSAVFSVVNGVLLEPLPFQDADRILFMKQAAVNAGVPSTTFSFHEIDDYRSASSTVDEFVEFGDWNFSVVGEGEPHRGVGGLVTSNYFNVLGIRPLHGRTLNTEDEADGAEPVMVLMHAYWTRAFGQDPSIVGRLVELTGKSTRIVGVLEPGMHYTGSRQQDFYVNYATNDHYQGASMRDARTHRMTDVFARVAPGLDLSAAQTEQKTLAACFREEYPEAYPTDLGYDLNAVPWQEELTSQARPTFLLLMGTVAAVLLLACANVANLTLTRLIRKEGELATRGALGATSADLRLHLTAENVILAAAGAGLGLVLAMLSRQGLVSYASRFTVRAQEVGVDLTVLLVTLTAGIGVAVLLAWLPGLPVNPGTQGVASSSSKATHGKWRKRVQRGLVVAQLAMSFTLLAGAGLLVRSMLNLYAVDVGFETENVLTVQAQAGNFQSQQNDTQLFQQAIEEIRGFPGVRFVAVAQWAPLTGRNPIAWNVRVEGGDDTGDRSNLMSTNNVSPGYFDALGMRLVAGRFLTHMDMAETDTVVVVNESMARTYFGDQDAVGGRLSFSFNGQTWTPWHRVVGVVADSREYGIDRTGIHTIYRPADQTFWGPTLVVSTQGDPTALAAGVQEIIHSIDPNRPVDRIQTLDDLREADVAPSRLNATLFGAFAALALLIAAVGVLGVLAFSVSQRVREFGIRMALGADRGSILRGVLFEGVALVVVSLLVGAAASVALGRVLSNLLFSVDPVDPTSMVAAGAILGVVALTAAFIPARRATLIQPVQALKTE